MGRKEASQTFGRQEKHKMNVFEAIGLSAYIMMAVLMLPVFMFWLYGLKSCFHSWLLTLFVGISLACVWPLSLVGVVMHEHQDCNDEKHR